MNLVVVESPSKAKTIQKYLGKDYKVLASYGHIRDLPSKSGSVDPKNAFQMLWHMEERSKKHLSDIKKALKGAKNLYLATDPDREGEAISWHLFEALKEQGVLENIKTQRVVFYEITKKAVCKALDEPRSLDQGLIDAYLARRGLDYLVGFTLSPVLWTRLPGSRSAGRVQSVALRLVTEREQEIEAFQKQEYWTLEGLFFTHTQAELQTKLWSKDDHKIGKFDIHCEEKARQWQKEALGFEYAVHAIEKKKVSRHPAAPFITSTLQQEAARKLRFSARKTMQIAQKLYEGIDIQGETKGLITYMRTDSVSLSKDVVAKLREHIQDTYGANYVTEKERVFKSRAKNAQEAHEAIRPTSLQWVPEKIKPLLDKDQFALYNLIWKRFLACQMSSAIWDQVTCDVASQKKEFVFRATGRTLHFDGFLRIYEEGKDEGDDQADKEQSLPKLDIDQKVDIHKIIPHQHFTQPPPRFTEASLVKKLEELGIGRPSTYASIMSTLMDRGYVGLDKRTLIPEPLGRLLTTFLTAYFEKYLAYEFTADLESQLDDICTKKRHYLNVLESFWAGFDDTITEAKKLRITDVLALLEKSLYSYIFPIQEEGLDPKTCPKCKEGTLSLRLGKFGAFVGCDQYPECKYTRALVGSDQGEENKKALGQQEALEPRILGEDPKTGESIALKKGPYGFYYQWGEGEGKKKPKRASLPKGTPPEKAHLEQALFLGSLPLSVGKHPETGEPISASIGRYGPYVKHKSTLASLKKQDDLESLTLERACELLNEAQKKKK